MMEQSKQYEDALAYIRRRYLVPAYIGQRIRYEWPERPRYGTIIGADDGHLLVILDGGTRAGRYHPTWEIEYIQEPSTKDNEHAAAFWSWGLFLSFVALLILWVWSMATGQEVRP